MHSGSSVAIRVGFDAGAGVLGYAILVDDPLQRGAVAEAVLKTLGRQSPERKRRVYFQLGLVLAQLHLVRDDVTERHALRFDELERPRFKLFVVQVQFRELLARIGEGLEVRGERDARWVFASKVFLDDLANSW